MAERKTPKPKTGAAETPRARKRRRKGLPPISQAGALFRSDHPFHAPGSREEMNFIFTGQLTTIARGWRTLLNEHLRRIGQTQARWDALYWVGLADETASQRDLAERMAVEGPTLVRMLNILENEGLVERQTAPSDRRIKTIKLGHKGEEVLAEIAQIARPVRDDVMTDITDEEMKTCLSVFERLLTRLDKC